jgi:hypothetical protein
MRTAGEQLLRGYPQFTSINGSRKNTTLPEDSVDLITAGQAFHWFDVPDRARKKKKKLKKKIKKIKK